MIGWKNGQNLCFFSLAGVSSCTVSSIQFESIAETYESFASLDSASLDASYGDDENDDEGSGSGSLSATRRKFKEQSSEGQYQFYSIIM